MPRDLKREMHEHGVAMWLIATEGLAEEFARDGDPKMAEAFRFAKSAVVYERESRRGGVRIDPYRWAVGRNGKRVKQ